MLGVRLCIGHVGGLVDVFFVDRHVGHVQLQSAEVRQPAVDVGSTAGLFRHSDTVECKCCRVYSRLSCAEPSRRPSNRGHGRPVYLLGIVLAALLPARSTADSTVRA